jgi:uncharacterized membrane protein YdjX (TVP38/TMEM64 family)
MALSRSRLSAARWGVLTTVVVAIVAGILIWRFTSASEFASADHLAAWMARIRNHPAAIVVVLALYVLAGLIVFPLVVLVAATAVVFPPLEALGLAFSGALLSATLLYYAGAHLLRGPLQQVFGPTMTRIGAALQDRGILAVAVVRLLPVAPFTVVNLAAGSAGVRFWDYLMGTALGLAPGIVVLTLMGDRLRALWQHPTPRNVAVLIAIVLGWIGLALVLQRAASQRRATTEARKGHSGKD